MEASASTRTYRRKGGGGGDPRPGTDLRLTAFEGEKWHQPIMHPGPGWLRPEGGRLAYAGGWEMLTSQEVPNLSTHMPNSSPQTCFCSGMVVTPPAASCSK